MIQWKIADLIDLEYFLCRDQKEGGHFDESKVAERDRSIFLKEIGSDAGNGESLDPSFLLKKWLDAMKRLTLREQPDFILPSRVWREFYISFSWLCLLAGLAFGASVAFSLLSYQGDQPVNVFVFLGVLVFSQMALILFVLISYVGRALLGKEIRGLLLVKFVRHLFLSGILRAYQATSRHIGLGNGVFKPCVVEGLKRVSGGYKNLLTWPFFILLQLFGVGFNLGGLLGTFVKVAGSDLAFGWQSTIQTGPQFVYGLVKILSAPWSWIFKEGVGYPTLSQIEGSRIILKEGAFHLSTNDLVSWWPFLCLCIIVYGLIPRLLLLVWGKRRLVHCLSRLKFDEPRFRQLIRRMTMPLVETHDEREAAPLVQYQGHGDRIRNQPIDDTKPIKEWDADVAAAGSADVLLLVPEELLEEFGNDSLKAVAERAGLRVLKMESFDEDCFIAPEGFSERLKTSLDHFGQGLQLVLLQEAWQPPLEEFLSFLNELSLVVADKGSRIVVLLVGKPHDKRIFDRVDKGDFQVWSQRLSELSERSISLAEASW